MRSRVALAFGEALELDVVSAAGAPPETGALVVPQDVYLILRDVTAGDEEAAVRTPAQALSEALRQRPRRRGTIVAGPRRAGTPLVLQAIVYDFEDAPPTRESFVFEALMAAFEEAGTRGLSSVAVQPLGTDHGGIAPERFLLLLTQVCYSSVELGTSLRRVHLLVSSPLELELYERLLREAAGGGRSQGR
jgi:hypothetical protein